MPSRAVVLSLFLCLTPHALAQVAPAAQPAPAAQSDPTAPIHHDLKVRLDPDRHWIEVVDELALPEAALPEDGGALRFSLHAELEVESLDDRFVVEPLEQEPHAGHVGINDAGEGHGAPLAAFALRPAGGSGWPSGPRPRLRYAGAIHHPLEAEEQEYARSFSRTPGLIDERGAVLSGSTLWVPAFGDELCTFRLAVDVPAAWDAVSQGRRVEHRIDGDRRRVTWDCPSPMDEVHLVAAPFTEYSRAAGAVTAYAFLRAPDPALAGQYLEATAQYLAMYADLIGPYPYAKFALVENFWETGYGMPSFTLLGSQVIRLPFILHSSYPHEILHNWWGNSVFVDYAQGNWCEGLTAYLADHLVKEGQGKGAEYRRDALERYRNYVRAAQDFPLREFRARHSSATEAVGYGKSLMLFHMLRRTLGDATFVRGLQAFYRELRFRRAGFADLARVFGAAAGRDLGPFFAQWVEREGAPELELAAAEASADAAGQQYLDLVLRQVQPARPFALSVPVAVLVLGEQAPRVLTIAMDGREAKARVPLPGAPRLVQVDPAFDLFRRLDRSEIPPTAGQLFGAARVLIVLPVDDPLGEGWRTFAAAWTGGAEVEVEVTREDELDVLPADRAVWILGAKNRFARQVAAGVEPFGAGLGAGSIEYGPTRTERNGHAFVFVCRHPRDADGAIGWIGADLAAALPGLARKLPHYGKYSYLGFAGEEPQNVVKGTWPALDSPLEKRIDPDLHDAPPRPAGEPLARVAPVFDPERLGAHVRFLADDALDGRGVGTAGLDRAADWIGEAFAAAGLMPSGDDGTFFQSFYEPGGPDGRPVLLRNVVGVLVGTDAARRRESVVVGAHYDHLGRGWPDARSGMAGQIHNGADDNASGVAVLLEVARVLAGGAPPKRSIVFVAFTAEEWGLKGSRQYVRAMHRYPVTDAIAMLNLDTVGRLRGKKLTVFGTGSADEWIHIAMGIGFTTGVESTAVPDDLGASDQKSFLEAGVPAVQLFSGANEDYHRPSDDADKIDADGLCRVATFVREAARYLADREEPLTSRLAGATPDSKNAATPPGARRASLGTMPDFAFAGPGVRVAKVTPGSPAAAAGLAEGDVIVAIDGAEIADLRAYSDALKSRAPDDVIRIELRRGGRQLELEATLTAR